MKNQFGRACVIGIIILLILCGTALTSQAQVEQTTFGAEELIQKPAKIPARVLAQLKRDSLVKQCIAKKGAVKNSWFSAAEIDLNGDQTTDYVVKAKNACLLGANLAPFWVFHNLAHRYSLVLRADAVGLEFLRDTTDDYRDIKLLRATATAVGENIVKFDGAHYR